MISKEHDFSLQSRFIKILLTSGKPLQQYTVILTTLYCVTYSSELWYNSVLRYLELCIVEQPCTVVQQYTVVQKYTVVLTTVSLHTNKIVLCYLK